MTDKNTKITQRWVTNNAIRFAGRTFNPPELVPYNNGIVQVAYITFVDTCIHILDADSNLIVTCKNRVDAPVSAALRPVKDAWEDEAVRLFNAPKNSLWVALSLFCGIFMATALLNAMFMSYSAIGG